MNRLKEISNLKRFAKNLDLKSVDAPMLSKFANGRCNPTVEQARAICLALKKDVFEVWERSDLDYTVISTEKAVKRARHCRDNGYPKFTIRVAPAIATAVNEQCHTLRLTQAEWIAHAALLISKTINKNTPASVATTDRSAEKNTLPQKYNIRGDLSNVQ